VQNGCAHRSYSKDPLHALCPLRNLAKSNGFWAQFGQNGSKIAPTHSFLGVRGLYSPDLCKMGVPIGLTQKIRCTHFVRYAIWPKVTVYYPQIGQHGSKIAGGVTGLFSPELCKMGVSIGFVQNVRTAHFVRYTMRTKVTVLTRTFKANQKTPGSANHSPNFQSEPEDAWLSEPLPELPQRTRNRLAQRTTPELSKRTRKRLVQRTTPRTFKANQKTPGSANHSPSFQSEPENAWFSEPIPELSKRTRNRLAQRTPIRTCRSSHYISRL